MIFRYEDTYWILNGFHQVNTGCLLLAYEGTWLDCLIQLANLPKIDWSISRINQIKFEKFRVTLRSALFNTWYQFLTTFTQNHATELDSLAHWLIIIYLRFKKATLVPHKRHLLACIAQRLSWSVSYRLVRLFKVLFHLVLRLRCSNCNRFDALSATRWTKIKVTIRTGDGRTLTFTDIVLKHKKTFVAMLWDLIRFVFKIFVSRF